MREGESAVNGIFRMVRPDRSILVNRTYYLDWDFPIDIFWEASLEVLVTEDGKKNETIFIGLGGIYDQQIPRSSHYGHCCSVQFVVWT